MTNNNTQYDAFIGIDVAKKTVMVHDSENQSSFETNNTNANLQSLMERLAGRNCLLVCEATGGYEANLLECAQQASITIHRADARKVKAFIRSFGQLGKTDAIDAKALAAYGRERAGQLPLWQARDEKRVLLQALVMRRDDLVAQRVAETNRRKAPQIKGLEDTFEPIMEVLNTTVSQIEIRIRNLVESDERMTRTVAILITIPGIAHTTARNLLALLPELGTLTRRKIAALAGLAPHPRQSGKQDGYRSIRGGRPNVRRAIFMAAMTASRSNTDLGRFATRLKQNGKKPIVAITALMRKIITIANAKIRDSNCKMQQS